VESFFFSPTFFFLSGVVVGALGTLVVIYWINRPGRRKSV
jgi:hypothetical protein